MTRRIAKAQQAKAIEPFVARRNPFHDPLVSEHYEDPERYLRNFSWTVVRGDIRQVFEPRNIVLLGPQGTGKTMILNLIRHRVISEALGTDWARHELGAVPRFLGISINLARVAFSRFGSRPIVAPSWSGTSEGEGATVAAAGDFMMHYLFDDFLSALAQMQKERSGRLRDWLDISDEALEDRSLARDIADWECWSGWYRGCRTLPELQVKAKERLRTWHSFLNYNLQEVPDAIWHSKASVEEPLHQMGNLLGRLSAGDAACPLYVLLDQYEELPNLSATLGSSLQRLVNRLLKARDPVVFTKLGARTYDWGRELRVWGSDSRLEFERDYATIDLRSVLGRTEGNQWLFPSMAEDVARRRIANEAGTGTTDVDVKEMFGEWRAESEAALYVRATEQAVPIEKVLGRKIPEDVRSQLVQILGEGSSLLDARLAAAWVQQRLQRGEAPTRVVAHARRERPWRNQWWRKERIEIALLQIASLTNQRRYHFGWDTVLHLSGSNIGAFLYLAREIWDVAARFTTDMPPGRFDYKVQTDGILNASQKWRVRDRVDVTGGGALRYDVMNRLGPGIHDSLVEDLAISNPGHSGFSLQENDLVDGPQRERLKRFLEEAVNWAYLEERRHTPKSREGRTRLKWFIHGVLAPVYELPIKRVKEPYYARVEEVQAWVFDPKARVRLAAHSRGKKPAKKK